MKVEAKFEETYCRWAQDQSRNPQKSRSERRREYEVGVEVNSLPSTHPLPLEMPPPTPPCHSPQLLAVQTLCGLLWLPLCTG
ncbi:hypothetical protein CEXT_751811 [Caerostris extrusa]|uniref:Uncharacterized protein n=1 Tax=Caerostris extrusa TaxID=172846 RepID=A0AAV4XLQ1_CAEEX|nr:hypothetical protein CEXT_751811 [Caerostris extrusa]